MITKEDQINRDNFLIIIKQLDPELYMIKIALEETDINPLLVPQIIRSLGNLTFGTGYGKVEIFMESNIVTQIKGQESIKINQSASKEVRDEI